jgi:Cellulase (glycosyl hydrolase family 5)/Fibronectin type III domain/Calcineurin-like phosphoesterase
MRTKIVPTQLRLARATIAGVLTLTALLWSASEASADTYTFRPTDDTYIRSDQPTTNYGSSVRFSAQGSKSQVRRAYLRFNVQLPIGQTITSAALRLHTLSSATVPGVNLRGTLATEFSEKTLTWSNAPGFGATVDTAQNYGNKVWISLNASSLVTRSGPVAFTLTTTSTTWDGFDSKEASSSNAPNLVVQTVAMTFPDPGPSTSAIPPSATTHPTVTGTPLVGQTLTAADGTWTGTDPITYTRQWERCDQQGLGCTAIGGATGSTYALQQADNGSTVRVTVTGTNAAGSASASSATTAVVTAPTSTTPSATGPQVLHATSSAPFVDPNGHEIRLLGLNVIPVWAGHPGSTWDQAKYDSIHAKGFNAVRFVLYWDDFEPAAGQFDQTSLNTLDTAISRAKAAGLYVILDEIHLWGSGGFNDVPAWARTGDSVTTVQTNGAGYLKMLAQRYRSEPAVAGYDLVNEFYRSPIDQNAVLRAYDSLISAVRTVDPDKIVLIEPSYGDSSMTGAAFSNLTNRSNVVYSLHDYYAGGAGAGYNSGGGQTGYYTWDGTTGYPSPNPSELEQHLQNHLTTVQAAGLPMWIGEFGIGTDAVNRDQWIKDAIALFNKSGLGRAWWEYHTTGPLSATNSDYTWKTYTDLLLDTTAVPTGTTPAPPADTTAPAVPTGLTATAGDSKVTLTWAANGESDLAGYRVYRRNADGTWPTTATASTTTNSWTDSGRANGTTYTYRITAIDTTGNESAASAVASATPAAPATTGSDPVVVAAGDVACPSASPGTTSCGQKYTGDLIRSINPDAVIGLGDYQYDTGTLANFASYYTPFWGSFKDKTRAINGGSHDFYGGGDYYTYFGASAGPAPYASYSYDIGNWHLIALNDYCDDTNVGGCGVGTKWYNWLKTDLAMHPNTCTLAYWHQPYWTSGATHAPYTGVKDYIQLLYDNGVDVLLQAHNHQYERFAPQNPNSQRDDAKGIEAFVVGTGGRSFYGFNSTPAPNSLVRNADTFGVLKLTLHPTSYDYTFVPIAGQTFTDSGSRTCH